MTNLYTCSGLPAPSPSLRYVLPLNPVTFPSSLPHLISFPCPSRLFLSSVLFYFLFAGHLQDNGSDEVRPCLGAVWPSCQYTSTAQRPSRTVHQDGGAWKGNRHGCMMVPIVNLLCSVHFALLELCGEPGEHQSILNPYVVGKLTLRSFQPCMGLLYFNHFQPFFS